MSQLKMIVVGVGALGRHHARILSSLPDVDLIAVAEPNEQQGRSIAEAHNTTWVADYHEVIDQCDAASIVVPTTLHRRIAGDFLERGIHTLVEKPLTADVAEGCELCKLAEANNAVLQVGHVERFNPAFSTAEQIIKAPKYIKAERFSPYSFRSTDISVVHDMMIHDIELVHSLVNSPLQSAEAFGFGLMGGLEDTVQARLRFENGTIADLSANRINPEVSRAMQVWSASGCVNIDFQTRDVQSYRPSAQLLSGPSPLELASQPNADIQNLKERVFGEFIETKKFPVLDCDALTAELQHFVTCVQTGRTPAVDGWHALEALKTAEAVLESIRSHAWGAQSEAPHIAA